MKILQVGNHFAPCVGGAEKVMQDLAAILSMRGHLVRIVCLNRCANSAKILPAHEKEGKIQIERIPFLDLKYYKIALGIFKKLRDADIVHVHGVGFFSDILILTKPLHRKKIVISTHGGIFHTKDIQILKHIYFNALQRVLLGFADRIIAVSKNDYALFSKITSNVTLAENGVDLSGLAAKKKKRGTFLFVGRFSKNKRVDKLLEAFKSLKATDFELIIAGVDWENLLAGYKDTARDLGIEKNVKFVLNPENDELRQLYAGSEFFVSASQYEGFGLALVEAMACGCIPLVQKNEGFSSILEGFPRGPVSYDDAKNAAKEIEKAASSSGKDALGKKAVKFSKKFSAEKSAKTIERIYTKLGAESGFGTL